ncbi:MAG: sulfurtransferase [Micavibrio aeruginosavorus]|uniref:Sulfurtransferase n=1 Tax=Micavibrio aeruginosavorus TaxID=349221 RepID=A0A2W5PTS2_9BACT|nr:MAG: sulfurtransferase [Micavibrio aeruginosavorus]
MEHNNISPQQAHTWLASGEAILIDVREPDEFKAEHIAYAISLPLAGVSNLIEQMQIPIDRKIIFHCFRGKRGEQACALMQKKNATCSVYNIEGGINSWKVAGYPVVLSANSKISIFRQVQIIVGLALVTTTLVGFSGQAWGFTVSGFLGAALTFAGISGWCGLAALLTKAPWNKK